MKVQNVVTTNRLKFEYNAICSWSVMGMIGVSDVVVCMRRRLCMTPMHDNPCSSIIDFCNWKPGFPHT